jgi:hypothetical protein
MFWYELVEELLGSFSVWAWKAVTAVPGGSPAAPPMVLVLALPKAEPNPVEVPAVVLPPPPKSEPPVVAGAPKPVLLAVLPPNMPPPVLLPNADVVVLFAVFPKPPNPVPVAAVVLVAAEPKRPPPVVPVVDPKAGFAPKPLAVLVAPKPPVEGVLLVAPKPPNPEGWAVLLLFCWPKPPKPLPKDMIVVTQLARFGVDVSLFVYERSSRRAFAF